MCALLVFGCAKAPEQPSAPEEQEASRPDDSEPPIDSGFTWDDGTAEDMEGHIIYPDIQLNFKEDGRVLSSPARISAATQLTARSYSPRQRSP